MEPAHAHNLLWHYVGSFTLYTLLAIGVIYGLFLYFRKNPATLNGLASLGTGGGLQFGKTPLQSQQRKLEVETVLALEPRKTLYIVRADQERFLIATSMEGTQFLAKLSEEAGLSETLENLDPEKHVVFATRKRAETL